MTWNALTPGDLLATLQQWEAQDWPVAEAGRAAAAERLGWSPTDDESVFDTHNPPNRPKATITATRGKVNDVDFYVTDVDLTDSPERDAFMNDTYTSCLRGLSEAWGKPKQTRGKNPSAIWDLPNGSRVELVNRHRAVKVTFSSPQIADTYRRVER